MEPNQEDVPPESPATQSLCVEVCKGDETGGYYYVIEQSANGDPTILPQELANLLLAAEQSLQGISTEGTSEIQLVPQIQEEAEGQTIVVPNLDVETANEVHADANV